jgi:hypothetical protein
MASFAAALLAELPPEDEDDDDEAEPELDDDAPPPDEEAEPPDGDPPDGDPPEALADAGAVASEVVLHAAITRKAVEDIHLRRSERGKGSMGVTTSNRSLGSPTVAMYPHQSNSAHGPAGSRVVTA